MRSIERRWTNETIKAIYDRMMAEIEGVMTPPVSIETWPPEHALKWRQQSMRATEHMRRQAGNLMDLFTVPLYVPRQQEGE